MVGMTWIVGLAAVVLVAYAICFVRLVRFANTPSAGPRIPAGRTKTALLLVDMQREHFEGEHPEDEKRLLVAVKDAISRARGGEDPRHRTAPWLARR